MCCPTSGTVNVCGYDVVDNTAEARANLSFCQQQDVFFADLTVSEHLAYFGALKGIERSALQARVSQTLKEVHLDDKAHCTTSVLSGGMKKRLSVAIATISKPKVVVLDEPTAGLDPETRRDIWELFLSLRRECTLLIATHDMAEADALGDRVAVMAQGTVQCCGSPAFLKKAFGAGYQVHISRKPSVAFQLYDIMNIIKGTVPEAELRRHRQTDVTVVLHVLDCAGFENMFAQLEAQSDALGIDSIGVSVSTIQDVFVKINREETNLLSRSFVPPADQDHAQRVATTEGAGGSCGGIVVALFIKRLLCFYRSLVSPLTAWILPLLVFWALVALEGSLVPEPKRWLRRLSVRLSLADAYPGAGAFVHTDDPSRTAAQEAFLPALEAQTERLDVLADPGWQLPAMARRDFHGYTQAYALGISVTRRTIQQGKRNMSRTAVQGWHNPYATISRELALSVASTAALRLLTGDQRAGIFARTVIHDVNEARADQAKDADEEFTEYLKQSFLTTLLRTFLVPLGVAPLMATMVLLPTSERASGAKDLQLMTGLSGALYWLANWLFDFFVYIFAWATICALLSSYQPLLFETKFSLLLVLVAFSGPGLLFSYAFSLFARTQSGGFTSLMLAYAVGGTVLVFAYFARKVTPRGVLLPTSAVDVLVMLVPPFSLAVSLIKVLRMDLDNKECLRARQSLGSGSSFLATYCGKALEGYARFGAVSAKCCALMDSK
ncbi:phospholipid-transporting ATPase ABCA3-like [Amblyomma americanum]